MALYNPIRRNRNIGTSAQGHGKDNRLVIPRPRRDRVYWESVTSFAREDHILNGNRLSFFTERLRPIWFHACSIQDVLAILRDVPAKDLRGMNAILFRQPTRKQTIVSPSWGRLTYNVSLGIPVSRTFIPGLSLFLRRVQGRLSSSGRNRLARTIVRSWIDFSMTGT